VVDVPPVLLMPAQIILARPRGGEQLTLQCVGCRLINMTVTVQIPDDLAQRIRAQGGDLSRHILEVLALEEYRCGHLTKPELRRLLGFETRQALDGFLKAHDILEDYSVDDLEHDRQDLRRLGF
jgi:hypothetical protein